MLEKAKYMDESKLNVGSVASVSEGQFPFTNFTDKEFRAKWDGKEYIFPANRTTPMLGMISNATPEQIQYIRKKFARELGEQEFYRSDKFKRMDSVQAGYKPAPYTESDLTVSIQRCLEPLPIAQAKVVVLPKDSEENYRKDETGELVSKVIGQKESLIKNGSVMTE